MELATLGSWSGVGDFRQLDWSWRLQAIGVELENFRQLEWS